MASWIGHRARVFSARTVFRSLQAQKLVRRSPSPSDKHVQMIEAAPATLRRQRGIEAVLEETDDHCFRTLTAAERTTRLELMNKCIASFGDGS